MLNPMDIFSARTARPPPGAPHGLVVTAVDIAPIFIDLDGFKPINDTQGHETGDWLLRAVVQRLSECLRKYDTAACLGGEEFVVLLPSLLFRHCNQLLDLTTRPGMKTQDPQLTLLRLVQSVEAHFQHEERILKQVGYRRDHPWPRGG